MVVFHLPDDSSHWLACVLHYTGQAATQKEWEEANNTPHSHTSESTQTRNHYQFRLQDGVTFQECIVTGSACAVLALFLAVSRTSGDMLFR